MNVGPRIGVATVAAMTIPIESETFGQVWCIDNIMSHVSCRAPGVGWCDTGQCWQCGDSVHCYDDTLGGSLLSGTIETGIIPVCWPPAHCSAQPRNLSESERPDKNYSQTDQVSRVHPI